MPASSLLVLIDDIATVLDDVAVMSKVAAKKTAGVLGDDLALNAQQVTGISADRELPVVWAVAKGSFVNKLILVPAALAISAVLPAAITPLLMLGGAFLCYEGFHKIAEKFLHPEEADAHHQQLVTALADPTLDLVAYERDKIKGAVRTDFILSAEIIVISLGTVADANLLRQLMVLSVVSVVMTLGVYGLVGAIVKLDDAGLYLNRRNSAFAKLLGRGLLGFAPRLMKTLSVVGTAAMFLVGGGILMHGLPMLHHIVEPLTAGRPAVVAAVLPLLAHAITGLVAGGIVTALLAVLARLRGAVSAR